MMDFKDEQLNVKLNNVKRRSPVILAMCSATSAVIGWQAHTIYLRD